MCNLHHAGSQKVTRAGGEVDVMATLAGSASGDRTSSCALWATSQEECQGGKNERGEGFKQLFLRVCI